MTVEARTVTAAAITYREVIRPPWVPDDLQPAGNSSLQFLDISTLDGVIMEAAISAPALQAPSAVPLIISVHGSGGNYAASVPGILLRLLPARAYAVLGINTRQRGERINSDNFYDIRRDIEAAVAVGRRLGFKRIVLHGHSLGNIQVQFFSATNWDPDITGVVLTGMFANLPWKSHHLLVGDEARYREMRAAAQALLREGRATDPLPLLMPSYDRAAAPLQTTAQHFLTYRDDSASAADGTYWIKRIPRPILLIRDEGDLVVNDFEPHMLVAAARSEGSLVPCIDFVSIPNPQGPSRAGHSFHDTADQLVHTILQWLQARGI